MLKNKELVQLLKLAIGKNNPKESLNYALYDFKNRRVVVTDIKNMIIVYDIELEQFNENTLLALNESKTKLLTVKLNEDYPNYERIIPTNTIKSYNNISDLLHDNTLKFPYYNKNLQNILTRINIESTKYNINNSMYSVDFIVNNYDCKLIFTPISHIS